MRFFFYGTLIAGSGNAVARSAHAALRPLGPASIAGRLWAIPDPAGWYPALVAGRGWVCGELYEAMAGFDAAALARLDAYEGFDPDSPATSDYRRGLVTARFSAGVTCRAQAYRYARALPAAALAIPDGDFAAFLRLHHLRGFGA